MAALKKQIRRSCLAGGASQASQPSPSAGTLFYSIVVGALSDDLAQRGTLWRLPPATVRSPVQ